MLEALRALIAEILNKVEQYADYAVNFQLVRVERGQLPVLFVLFPLISGPEVSGFMRDVDLLNGINGDELIFVKIFIDCWGHRCKATIGRRTMIGLTDSDGDNSVSHGSKVLRRVWTRKHTNS